MDRVKSFDRTFAVYIEPQPKERPRQGIAKGSGKPVFYTPKRTMTFEKEFSMFAFPFRPGVVLDVPLRVDILAVQSRPRRLLRKKDPDGLIWSGSARDKDNIEKAVLDALSPRRKNGVEVRRGFWTDDHLVVAGETLVAYAEKGGKPRIVVRIQTMDGDTVAGEAFRLGLIPELEPEPEEPRAA